MNIKKFNCAKEQYRGTVKQVMKVRGLRKINFDNYYKWLGKENLTNIHSLRLDLQDGYVNVYNREAYKSVDAEGNETIKYRCGNIIEDASEDIYKGVYDTVMSLLEDERDIPSDIRRNIMVSLNR